MLPSYTFSSQLIAVYLLSGFTISCSNTTNNAVSFSGEPEAIRLADQMFTAIGGKQGWCELQSLYIKAEHTEPQMDIPYTSEIWRGFNEFEMVIEQQNDSFHVKGIITDEGGKITYLDKRDTFRLLTSAQLKEWQFDHRHTVYVLLHDLACTPSTYSVRIDENKRLAFFQDSTFVCSFELDEKLRPYVLFHPNIDGEINGFKYTHWGTDHGLVHSAGGHPLDSNFMYRTQIWQSSKQSLRESFEGIMEED